MRTDHIKAFNDHLNSTRSLVRVMINYELAKVQRLEALDQVLSQLAAEGGVKLFEDRGEEEHINRTIQAIRNLQHPDGGEGAGVMEDTFSEGSGEAAGHQV